MSCQAVAPMKSEGPALKGVSIKPDSLHCVLGRLRLHQDWSKSTRNATDIRHETCWTTTHLPLVARWEKSRSFVARVNGTSEALEALPLLKKGLHSQAVQHPSCACRMDSTSTAKGPLCRDFGTAAALRTQVCIAKRLHWEQSRPGAVPAMRAVHASGVALQ